MKLEDTLKKGKQEKKHKRKNLLTLAYRKSINGKPKQHTVEMQRHQKGVHSQSHGGLNIKVWM